MRIRAWVCVRIKFKQEFEKFWQYLDGRMNPLRPEGPKVHMENHSFILTKQNTDPNHDECLMHWSSIAIWKSFTSTKWIPPGYHPPRPFLAKMTIAATGTCKAWREAWNMKVLIFLMKLSKVQREIWSGKATLGNDLRRGIGIAFFLYTSCVTDLYQLWQRVGY